MPAKICVRESSTQKSFHLVSVALSALLSGRIEAVVLSVTTGLHSLRAAFCQHPLPPPIACLYLFAAKGVAHLLNLQVQPFKSCGCGGIADQSCRLTL